jgi:hypothetical protein
MHKLLFAITGIFVGFGAGFLASFGVSYVFPGAALLYGAQLILGGIVGAVVGCIVGGVFGNQIGAKLENALGENAIFLILCIVCVIVFGCLFWLMVEVSGWG